MSPQELQYVDLIVFAGRTLIESVSKNGPWPGRIPAKLAGRVTASRTPKMGLRMLNLVTPAGRYVLLECNPQKVRTDVDGNSPKDKVMVRRGTEQSWLGQVRRYRGHKECWHLKEFNSL